MPPVIHVDTDAPLRSDRDGHLITDKLWGLYYKPDFHFGGVPGRRDAAVVTPDPTTCASTVRSEVAGVRGHRQLRRHVDSALAFCQTTLRRAASEIPERAFGRHRLLHARTAFPCSTAFARTST
jgi:hypothetical protein